MINAGAVLKFKLGDAADLTAPTFDETPSFTRRVKVVLYFICYICVSLRRVLLDPQDLLRNLRFLRTLIAFWNVLVLLLMITYGLYFDLCAVVLCDTYPGSLVVKRG